MLAACASRAGPPAAPPATSAEGAVEAFLRGVADSNLAKMASYWGSAKGPAISTNEPPDWEGRMVVMQAYLRSLGYRVSPARVVESDAGVRELQVELLREGCTRQVPFTVIKTASGGWIVNQIDLAAAGGPTKPCPVASPSDSTR